MGALSIRNVDERTKERLRVRAARNGRSMEAEVRAILDEAVAEPEDRGNFLLALRDRFQELGGVDLELPPRAPGMRPVPTFE
jgi:plasmid stability protein